MKLLLSSDGKTAIENLGLVCNKPYKNLKVAWVITATKTDENLNFLDRDLHYFLKNGIEPNIYDIKGKTLQNFEDDLEKFDIIFMEGGNTFYLLQAIRESKFDKYLKNWLKTKPYVGVSAGTYVACPTIEMATWKHPNREKFGIDDLNALGLVDFLITVHYKEEYLDFIRKGMHDSKKELRILKDGQALLVEDNNITLVGDQEKLGNELL